MGGPTVSAACKGSYSGGHRLGLYREDQHALGPREEGAEEKGGNHHSVGAMNLEQNVGTTKNLDTLLREGLG